MDYILEGEIWRKLFQNHVENLHKYYKSVRMQIKTFQEKDLLHNEEQTLTEEELLLICSDRMSENIFHGFSVRQFVTGNMLEKVVFMFKTRPHDVTRSAPVVGTSQNVGAVNGDDDDGKRDCGEDKGSHGHGGSRGDSKTSSHVGQG